jgi:hypothetical protein
MSCYRQGSRITAAENRGLLSRAKLFFTAYFDSLMDPGYESQIRGHTPTLKENAERRRRSGAKGFRTVDDLPADPKSCGG